MRFYTRNKLYHIPINLNLHHDQKRFNPKNITSLLKLPNLEDKELNLANQF